MTKLHTRARTPFFIAEKGDTVLSATAPFFAKMCIRNPTFAFDMETTTRFKNTP